MTINSSTSKTIVLGNGSQTQFAFGFVGVAAAYISVIYTDASGNETVLARGSGATQYQIALNPAVQGALWGLGGTVTYDPSGTPIPVGSSLTMFRTLPLTQAISLQNLVSLSTLGNGAEAGLDTLEMQLQQVSETFGRAIVAPIVDPDTINLTLPAAAQRANLVLGFDGNGDVIATAAPASGTISSAMQPVVNAATLAAGRTAFGLGAMAVEGIGGGLQDDGAGNARVLFGVSQVAANQTIGASAFLTKFEATGALTFTLGRANTLWNGFGFWIDALTAAITLTPNSNDTIIAQGATSGGSIQIPQGAVVFVKTNAQSAGTWWIEWMSGQSAPAIAPSVANLKLTNNTATPNTQIDVVFDGAILLNSSGGATVSALDGFTINAATTGLNGLDTGSLTVNTWYYAWTIGNGVLVQGLLSLSATAPTLPAGYTFKKYLGAVRTDGSSHFLRTIQVNQRAQYRIASGSNTATMPQMFSGTTSGVIGSVGVTPYVPPTAAEISVSVQVQNGIAGCAPSLNYAVAVLATGAPPVLVDVATGHNAAVLASLVLESPAIGFFSNTPTAAIYCQGWVDSKT